MLYAELVQHERNLREGEARLSIEEKLRLNLQRFIEANPELPGLVSSRLAAWLQLGTHPNDTANWRIHTKEQSKSHRASSLFVAPPFHVLIPTCMRRHQRRLYQPGKRSGAWLKYKVNKAQPFVIGGYTPDNPLDALIVGYYEGDKLMFASKVRNGFVPRLRREVWAKLRHLQADTCPFANLPEKKRTQWALTREEMKNCVWLKPELVAQIEFTEFTPDGHLRHSKFCGLRDDKAPREVVLEA